MDVMHATATSLMAQIHYRLSKMDSAIAMIKGVLPTLRQNSNVWFVGEAYMTLAKCYLKRESVDLAIKHLDKSHTYFMQCQDLVRLREVYYLQSRIHDTRKDHDKRDETSERFLDVSQQLAKGTLPAGLGDVTNRTYLEQLAKRQVHSELPTF